MKKKKIDSQTVEQLVEAGFAGYWRFVSRKPLFILLYTVVVIAVVVAIYNIFIFRAGFLELDQEFDTVRNQMLRNSGPSNQSLD